MKNFGISTKKFVRKITAIASATLMAGLSMGAATASLSDLSSTFIQSGELNAYVVVGTGGQSNVVGFAKDVAGSIVVASAFAQQAKTSTATSGSAVLSRNVTTGFLNGSFLGFGGSVPTSAETWTNAKSGFNWLPNTTVANSTSSAYANVTAKLTAASNTFFLEKTGNYTLTTDALTYNLTFNTDYSTSGNKGVGNGTQGIPFPDGKAYQITNWTVSGAGTAVDALNVTLGDYTSVATTKGTVNTVGSTGITFEVVEAYTSPENKLQVKVLSSSGTVLFNDKVSKGDVIYEGSGVTLLLSDYGVSVGSGISATIQWTTSGTVLRQGREHASFPGWKVWMTNNSDGITSIAWKYTPEGTTQVQLMPGESKSMLGGFFNVVAGAFDINSTGKTERTVTVYEAKDSAKDIYFVDENGTTHSIDINLKSDSFTSAVNQTTISSWIDGYSFTMNCWEITGGGALMVNLTRGTGYDVVQITNNSPFSLNSGFGGGNVSNFNVTANLTWSGATKCTDARYNLTILSFAAQGGNPINGSLVYNMSSAAGMADAWSNVSATGVNGTITFTEADLKTVKVTYARGSIDKVTTESDAYEMTSNGVRYTPFGSLVTKGSTVTIVYPDSQRNGKISVGRAGSVTYTLNSGDYSSELDVTLASSAGASETVNRIDVGLAKLDSEITSSTLSKPVILIGGWAVNSLVNELVSAGLIDTTEMSMDRAMVKLIDNAFNSKSALVIAGYEGDDTRLAAQVVASQVLGTMNILSGSSAILNTGVNSYSEVIVV